MIHLEDLTYTGEVKAETLISQMDIKGDVDVRMKGVFSRNYSDDLINITNDKDKTILELSRDGIFHLLPEGLFFEENRIRNISKNDFGNEYEQFEEEKRKIQSFFRIFDTACFKLSLELEQKLNAIAEQGNSIFINTFWDEPEFDTNNKYIAGIKTILPFVSHLRGNFMLLTDVLKSVLSAEKIEIKEISPFYKRFIIHKEGLSKEKYQTMDESLAVFFDFFCQWFLPIEVEFDYRIKGYKEPFTLGNTLLLDYNTHL